MEEEREFFEELMEELIRAYFSPETA